MSETDHPSEPVPDPSDAEVPEATGPLVPGRPPSAAARQPKPTLGDYLTIASPRNLVEIASELLDQAANPYGTRRRRRKKKTD
jgi:hypothetical protein